MECSLGSSGGELMVRRRSRTQRINDRKFRLGFVALVGASGTLMALQLQASLVAILGVTAVSLVLGYVLLWYLLSLG